MSAAPDRCLEEILGQPDAFRRAAGAMAEQSGVLADLAALAEPRPLVLAGMGSSYDACLAAAAVLGAGGILATPVEAAELLHVRLPALVDGGLLLIVSQSGASAEIVRLAEAVRALPRRPSVLAITNGVRTPLAARADLALDTAVGPETCPSTMTFAGALVALAAVAGILGAARGAVAALAGMPGASRRPAAATPDPGAVVAAVLGEVGPAAESAAGAAAELLAAPDAGGARLAAWLGARRTIVALGRGTGLAAAEMAVLTLQEVAGLAATALPTAEFRHGPQEIVGPDVAVVLFSLEPATEALDRAFAAELAAAGAGVLLVGPADPALPGVEPVTVGGPRGLLAPGVALVPIQLLARRIAHARGRRPGVLTHAAKVTIRE